MDTKTDSKPTFLDTLLLVVAVAVLVGSIFGYYYYANESLLLRSLGVLVGFILGVVIAFRSAQGKTLWAFIQGSRVELRKVVWPTREETVQTTLIVLVFATIMGTFFFLLDLGLRAFIELIRGI